MSYFSKRALRWAAPVALVGALGLAACGNDDTEAVRVAAPSVAGLGSDQHLNNQADELARQRAEQQLLDRQVGSDQHLNNAADEIARAQRANEAASARLAGLAEQQAHLDGQAELYGPQGGQASASNTAETGLADEQSAAQAADIDAGPKTAQAGNMAAQQANAEAYVEQQQDRASENTDSENAPILPYYSENSRP
jgi:hypothetical protein